MEILEIKEGLEKVNYIPTKDIVYAVSGCINQSNPLLVEGAPGTGKTSLAKAVATMLDIPIYRVQFYDGLTADKILYDYDYQKQLLTIEAIKSSLEQNLEGKNIDEAISIASNIDFYGKKFLIKRPVLKAISEEQKCVLLLDEVDKSSEEIEYTLLEVLEDFSMSIPQYGTIKCKDEFKPIVFLTSNNYRELSDALKRRCNYLYIESKTKDEILQILKLQANISDKLALGVANCLSDLQNMNLKQTPSIAEAITWATFLKNNFKNDFSDIDNTLFLLAKNQDDILKIKNNNLKKYFV